MKETAGEHLARTNHSIRSNPDALLSTWACSDCMTTSEKVNDHPQRPNWDQYFLDIATAVAARADCTRRQVGAVIVDTNRRIIGTGYNGAHPGGPSCLKGQCPRGLMSKTEVAPGSSYDTGAGSCIALHAEQNAVLYSDYTKRKGGIIYITCPPCEGCHRMLLGSGLSAAVFYSESGHLDINRLDGHL